MKVAEEESAEYSLTVSPAAIKALAKVGINREGILKCSVNVK